MSGEVGPGQRLVETDLAVRFDTGRGAVRAATDLGQPANPPVEDGLALMADALLAAGFTEDGVRHAIVDNSRRLALPD